MNKSLKNSLKKLGVYYALQGNYRRLLFAFKRYRLQKKYKQFKGSGYTCNCCAASYSKLVPDYPEKENAAAIETNKVIAGYGENILCPNCLSTARERLIIALLKNEIDVRGKKILHFSPEKNIYNFIKEISTVTTADIDPLMYGNIDKQIKGEDATRLSFAGESFDAVIGNHIMEHIDNDTKAMAEIFRVLKSGGRAILQIPYSQSIAATIEEPDINDPAKQSALFGQKDHVRIYLLKDYIQRLSDAGFTASVIPYEALQQYCQFAIQPGECFINIIKP